MDANQAVTVYTSNNSAEAAILKSYLEGEGIRCQLDGENQPDLAGHFNVNILVRAWDEGHARKALASHPRGRVLPHLDH